MKKLQISAFLTTALFGIAHAQIFVANYANGTIGEYTTSGATINASFISGLSGPFGIAISGNNLYVTEQNNGRIAEYTTSGSLVNPALVTGLSQPAGIAISGNDLFVANSSGSTPTTAVGEYTLSGQIVNASLISGIENPVGVVTDGNYLYVSAFSSGTVGKYTMSGTTVNSALIPGLFGPTLPNPGGLAVDGRGNIYVSTIDHVGEYTTSGGTVNADLISNGYNTGVGLALDGNGNLYWANNYGGAGGNIIGEYTTSGQTENALLITGLANPLGIAVVPEPSPYYVLIVGGGLSVIRILRKVKVLPNPALEPTPITPVRLQCGFWVGGNYQRRGSAFVVRLLDRCYDLQHLHPGEAVSHRNTVFGSAGYVIIAGLLSCG